MAKRTATKQTTPVKRSKRNTTQSSAEPSSETAFETPVKRTTKSKHLSQSTPVIADQSASPAANSRYNSSGQQHNVLPTADEIVQQLPYIKQYQPPSLTDASTLLALPVFADFDLATTVCSFGFFRLTPTYWLPSAAYYSADTHAHYTVSSAHGNAGTSAKADFDTFDITAEQQLSSDKYWTRDVAGTFVRSYNYGSQMQHILWLAVTQHTLDTDSGGTAQPAHCTTLQECLHSAQQSHKYIVIRQLHTPAKPPKSLTDLQYTDAAQLNDTDLATVIQQVIRTLRLYDDFVHYNELLGKLNVRNEVVPNLGTVNYLTRLYRDPTLFEDMCKCQLVTNITWNRTVQCCNLLTQHCSADGLSWPTPHDIMRCGAAYLAQKCNVGYRAERLVRLAQAFINDGLEHKLTAMSNDVTVTTHTLYKEVLALYGFGAFAANNVVQLLGRYDVVPSDSETARHIKQVNGMLKTTKLDMKQVDKLYEQRYARFAPYQYLVYWSELWCGYEKHLLAKTAAYKPPVLVTQEYVEQKRAEQRSRKQLHLP